MTGPEELRAVGLRPLLRIEITVADAVEVSPERRFVPLTGGVFVGRGGLRGSVLPGGSDWQRVRPDGVTEVEARYALLTDDGRGIEVHSSGVRRVTRPVAARIAAGERVDPDEYYFRTHVRLASADPGLAHLNDVIALSTGQRDRELVHIHVHEVL